MISRVGPIIEKHESSSFLGSNEVPPPNMTLSARARRGIDQRGGKKTHETGRFTWLFSGAKRLFRYLERNVFCRSKTQSADPVDFDTILGSPLHANQLPVSPMHGELPPPPPPPPRENSVNSVTSDHSPLPNPSPLLPTCFFDDPPVNTGPSVVRKSLMAVRLERVPSDLPVPPSPTKQDLFFPGDEVQRRPSFEDLRALSSHATLEQVLDRRGSSGMVPPGDDDGDAPTPGKLTTF